MKIIGTIPSPFRQPDYIVEVRRSEMGALAELCGITDSHFSVGDTISLYRLAEILNHLMDHRRELDAARKALEGAASLATTAEQIRAEVFTPAPEKDEATNS